MAVLLIVVACGLFAQAWPRFQASLGFAAVETALDRYFQSREIPALQLPALVSQARASIKVAPHHRYYEGLSQLLYLQALQADLDQQSWLRRPSLFQSLQAAEQSVSRAPAQPNTWLRMARLRAALGQPTQRVATDLRNSIYTGRVDPPLMVQRLQMAQHVLPEDDLELNSLLVDQLRLAWQVNRHVLLRAIRAQQLSRDWIGRLLANQDDALLKKMEQALDPVV